MSWEFGKRYNTPSQNKFLTPNLAAAGTGTTSMGSWTKNTDDKMVASTAVPGPNGESVVMAWVCRSVSPGVSGFSQSVTTRAGTYQVVVRAKYNSGSGGAPFLYVADSTVSQTAYYNLQTGVRGTLTGCNGYMFPLGAGWYEVVTFFTPTAVANTFIISPCDADASPNLTGNGTATDMYFSRCGLYEMGVVNGHDDAKSSPVRVTPSGSQLIAGYDGIADLTAHVGYANGSRTIDTKVLLTQNVSATGSALTDVNLVQVDSSGTGIKGAGNVGAGTQRVTLATDDANAAAIKTAVELVDNVVGTNGGAVTTGVAVVAGNDGTLNRTVSTDSSGAVYNMPKTVPTYEDTTNGRAIVFSDGHKKVTTTKGPTTVTTGTVAVDAIDCSEYGPFWIYLFNANGGAALTACDVQVSGDNTNWYTLTVKDADETACVTLAANSMGVAYKCSAGMQGYLRVLCSCGSTTTITSYLIAQR